MSPHYCLPIYFSFLSCFPQSVTCLTQVFFIAETIRKLGEDRPGVGGVFVASAGSEARNSHRTQGREETQPLVHHAPDAAGTVRAHVCVRTSSDNVAVPLSATCDFRPSVLARMPHRSRTSSSVQGEFKCIGNLAVHICFQEADNFSDFQVERLMKKSHLSRKIESVRKELNAGSTADVTASLAGDSGKLHLFPAHGLKMSLENVRREERLSHSEVKTLTHSTCDSASDARLMPSCAFIRNRGLVFDGWTVAGFRPRKSVCLFFRLHRGACAAHRVRRHRALYSDQGPQQTPPGGARAGSYQVRTNKPEIYRTVSCITRTFLPQNQVSKEGCMSYT